MLTETLIDNFLIRSFHAQAPRVYVLVISSIVAALTGGCSLLELPSTNAGDPSQYAKSSEDVQETANSGALGELSPDLSTDKEQLTQRKDTELASQGSITDTRYSQGTFKKEFAQKSGSDSRTNSSVAVEQPDKPQLFPVIITWQVPDQAQDDPDTQDTPSYIIEFGTSYSDLNRSIVVRKEELIAAKHPVYGSTYSYTIGQFPIDAELFVRVIAFTQNYRSEPSSVFVLHPKEQHGTNIDGDLLKEDQSPR